MHMASGYLYALVNQSMPGIVKVGCTTRNPFDRAKELHTTGVPTAFSVAIAIAVKDTKSAESKVHMMLELEGKRVERGREFFMVSISDLIYTFAKLSSDHILESNADKKETSLEEILEMASIYRQGRGDTAPDIKKSISLYEEAARLGSASACGWLGYIYRNGKGITKSPSKSVYYLEREKSILEEEKRNYWNKFEDIADNTDKPELILLWENALKDKDLRKLKYLLPLITINKEKVDIQILSTLSVGKTQRSLSSGEILFDKWIYHQAKELLKSEEDILSVLSKFFLESFHKKSINGEAIDFRMYKFTLVLDLCKARAETFNINLNFDDLYSLSKEDIILLGPSTDILKFVKPSVMSPKN